MPWVYDRYQSPPPGILSDICSRLLSAAPLARLKLGHRNRLLRRSYARDSITNRLSSSTNSKNPALHYKRLIICCDGTWQSSYDTASNPTNVTQFSRAVQTAQQQKDGTEIQQVVLYQPGLGTGAMGRIRSHIAGKLKLISKQGPLSIKFDRWTWLWPS